jgi:hypothetical protein
MNPEFLDFIRALSAADVRFLIVGAYAVNLYTDPRATGDLDIWIEATPENAGRLMRALSEFGAPLGEVAESDFSSPGVTLQIGISPRRIDILTEISGVGFDEAWRGRTVHPFGTESAPFLGKSDIIRNKKAAGRPKDLADLESLEGPNEPTQE